MHEPLILFLSTSISLYLNLFLYFIPRFPAKLLSDQHPPPVDQGVAQAPQVQQGGQAVQEPELFLQGVSLPSVVVLGAAALHIVAREHVRRSLGLDDEQVGRSGRQREAEPPGHPSRQAAPPPRASAPPIATRQAAWRAKYNGKSLAWSFPNSCRGRFLNMVMPAMKVVQTMEPR